MRKAFTLVELLVVVVIAIILVAVTLPQVKYAIDEGKLREGARQFNAYSAVAKARAQSTGRPAGVWMELGQIGDPNAAAGTRAYECSQLYIAEIPAPYSGDYQDSRCYVTGSPPTVLNFVAGCAASLSTLVEDGDQFTIQLDNRGHDFLARRNGATFQIVDQRVLNNELRPPIANGSAGYAFQIHRQPIRTGQPLELPQGIVIDVGYSGLGTVPTVTPPSKHILVMFSPGGGVGSVTIFDQTTGNPVVDTGTSKIHFLVGKTEQVEFPWNNRLPESNIADGSNYWVTINRRNGSVSTVENTPDLNQPYGTTAERTEFLRRAREFAITAEVKGGQ